MNEKGEDKRASSAWHQPVPVVDSLFYSHADKTMIGLVVCLQGIKKTPSHRDTVPHARARVETSEPHERLSDLRLGTVCFVNRS